MTYVLCRYYCVCCVLQRDAAGRMTTYIYCSVAAASLHTVYCRVYHFNLALCVPHIRQTTIPAVHSKVCKEVHRFTGGELTVLLAIHIVYYKSKLTEILQPSPLQPHSCSIMLQQPQPIPQKEMYNMTITPYHYSPLYTDHLHKIPVRCSHEHTTHASHVPTYCHIVYTT